MALNSAQLQQVMEIQFSPLAPAYPVLNSFQMVNLNTPERWASLTRLFHSPTHAIPPAITPTTQLTLARFKKQA
jgi:hypothetical protein